jgi:hypothetical protein
MNIVQQNDQLIIDGHKIAKLITTTGEEILVADLLGIKKTSIFSKIKKSLTSSVSVSNVSGNSNVIIQH